MRIISTFVVVQDSLLAVRYDNTEYESDDDDELSKCIEQWTDQTFLRKYFEDNIEDLNDPFWNGITIDEAILKTRKDALLLDKRLRELAEEGKYSRTVNLSELFEPLSKGKIHGYERDKAKGVLEDSWLRVYAIRLNPNFFVISGSAIKLRPTMNDRNHLLLELKKLEITRDYIINDVDDDENLEFVELY